MQVLGSNLGHMISRESSNFARMLATEAIKAKRDIAKSKLANDEKLTSLSLKIDVTQLRGELKESEFANQVLKDKTEKQADLIKKLTDSLSELQNENQYLKKKIKKYLRTKMNPIAVQSEQKYTTPLETSSKITQSIYRFAETPNEHLRMELSKKNRQIKEYKDKILEHLSDRNELLDIFRACVTETRKEWEKRKIRFTKSDKL
jgi:hypothetical protein